MIGLIYLYKTRRQGNESASKVLFFSRKQRIGEREETSVAALRDRDGLLLIRVPHVAAIIIYDMVLYK